MDRDAAEYGIDLAFYKRWRAADNIGDLAWILRRQSGDNGGPIDTSGRESS